MDGKKKDLRKCRLCPPLSWDLGFGRTYKARVAGVLTTLT